MQLITYKALRTLACSLFRHSSLALRVFLGLTWRNLVEVLITMIDYSKQLTRQRWCYDDAGQNASAGCILPARAQGMPPLSDIG